MSDRERFCWRAIVAEGERCWISQEPVTRGQWAKFIRTGAYFEPGWWPVALSTFARMRGERHSLGGDALLRAVDFSWRSRGRPVTNINWFEAAAYCRWQQGRLPWSTDYLALFPPRPTAPARRWPWSRAPVRPPASVAFPDTGREWCEDWWNARFRGRVVRAPDPSGTRRVFARDDVDGLHRMDPYQRRDDVGFRIVRDDSPFGGQG
jgi:hypothetical protein